MIVSGCGVLGENRGVVALGFCKLSGSKGRKAGMCVRERASVCVCVDKCIYIYKKRNQKPKTYASTNTRLCKSPVEKKTPKYINQHMSIPQPYLLTSKKRKFSAPAAPDPDT